MKLFLLKKKLTQVLEGCGAALIKFLLKCWHILFAKKTFLFVSNKGIKTIRLGSISQIVFLIGLIWCCNFFVRSVNHDKILSEKEQEIERLKANNSYFNEEFKSVNKKLEKVNEYFSSLSGGVKNVNEVIDSQTLPEKAIDESLSREEKQTMRYINNSKQNLAEISSSASYRLKKIESALLKTGLNLRKAKMSASMQAKASKNTTDVSNKNMGGPTGDSSEIDKFLANRNSKAQTEKSSIDLSFETNIQYLTKLERLVSVLPLARPMKGYYLSSGYGTRRDPITGARHAHYGLDFVGSKNEKILSPSPGKVILANWFSDYGNAVVIDHGNGITTRYGHLSQIRVKEGQYVKKGEVVATQGSTGRSTGPHLHYEVRYKNHPLNPKNFIEAGDLLFKNGQLKHANS